MGEDPFRARLRLAELVSALVSGGDPSASAAERRASARLGETIGVARHDARTDPPDLIALSGQAQGLFDAPGERRVVVVENADALADASFLRSMPVETAVVLLTSGPVASRRGARRKAAKEDRAVDLAAAVRDAGGSIEPVPRLFGDQVPGWIRTRAELAGLRLEPAAVLELASATGPDTARIEQEIAKLRAYASDGPVAASTVRELVPGAIETEVFDLTRAVVRKDAREAVALLERLLDEGQAPQQILALLLWQFRVLLFAMDVKGEADAEAKARAIRSSGRAIMRWRAEARRLSKADVTRAYESLYATDLAIKQGRTDDATAMMLCVLDLCGVNGADVRELVIGEPPRR